MSKFSFFAIKNNALANIVVLITIIFVIIISRLFFLALSTTNSTANIHNNTNIVRKEITDRNYEPLAVNLPVASLFAHPEKINNPRYASKKISNIIKNLDCKTLLPKLESKKKFVWLTHNITPVEQELIETLGITGIGMKYNYKRFYTYGKLLSHIIGYVDIDNYGIAGIERGLDQDIRNIETKVNSINLSIDLRLQNLVSEELNNAKNVFRAHGGCAIVASVKTGEILACVNEPSFDPNCIKPNHITEELINKNTLALYELGSIFKPIIIAIGIDSNIIDLHDVYDITDLQLGKYNIQDYTYTSGWHTLAQIFAKSSNKGMSKIALEIGEVKIKQYLKKLGLLEEIKNIEIPEKAKPIYPNITKQWLDVTLGSLAYGYSIALTPLHYIQAMLPIVNGGKMLPITFLKNTSNVYHNYKQVLHPNTSEKLKILMRLAVSHGTCAKAYVGNQDVGGKTGTANKVINGKYSKDARISSVIASFPINNPQYIIYAMLDEPKGNKETNGKATGGYTVAPIVQKIIARIATLYGMEQQHDNYEEWHYLLVPPHQNNNRKVQS